jgi:hypothetical protein
MGNICNKNNQTVQYCMETLKEDNFELKEKIELQNIHIYNLEQKIYILISSLKNNHNK